MNETSKGKIGNFIWTFVKNLITNRYAKIYFENEMYTEEISKGMHEILIYVFLHKM